MITTSTKGRVGTIPLYEQQPNMGAMYEPWVSHYVWWSSIMSGEVKQQQDRQVITATKGHAEQEL